jgi:hypothetical protein
MNTSSKNATKKKLLNGNENNIDMNTIRNEAFNNDNDADDDEEPRFKLVNKRWTLKSNKWIILLIFLCLILLFGLIISFIKNNQCNNEKNKCSNEKQNQLDNSSTNNFVSDLNKNVNNKQQSKPQSKWADESQDSSYWNESRLPSNLVPIHYNINLRINVKDRYFIGNCSIQFNCLKSIKFLVLHVDTNILLNGLPKIFKTARQNITFENDYEIIDSTTEQLKVKGIKINAFYQYLIVELAENQKFESTHNYIVLIENFSSKIGNNLKGIYYSTFNQNNTTK